MIEPKAKPCKGTGKAKGYGCGTVTKYRIYGIGKMCCYADWLYNSEAGKIKVAKAHAKASKDRRELEIAKVEKKSRSGLTTLLKSVVNVFHAYVRERDKGKPCIACDTQWKSDFQASHYYKSELYSTLKLHEDNVHGGCMECNLRKEGNLSEYAVNLPNRIGIERFEALNNLASLDKSTSHKWDRENLKQIRTDYNTKLKNL